MDKPLEQAGERTRSTPGPPRGSIPRRGTTRDEMHADLWGWLSLAMENLGPLKPGTAYAVLHDRFEDVYTKNEIQSCFQRALDSGAIRLDERMRFAFSEKVSRNNDHPSHAWRYSDSSLYDFVCEKCGCVEMSYAAREECRGER